MTYFVNSPCQDIHAAISAAPCRRFSRIQSTACEQQRFEALVAGLDPELLMALAAGRTCLLWDCARSVRKAVICRNAVLDPA